jgi:hypothetical protein
LANLIYGSKGGYHSGVCSEFQQNLAKPPHKISKKLEIEK